MSALVLRNRFQGNTTLVENEFIDNYMAAANGEYVKVYLLLLRHINNPSVSLSISYMADVLENTEGDILRALKYWEKEGLLTLEYDHKKKVTGLELGKVPDSSAKAADSSTVAEHTAPAAVEPAPATATSGTVAETVLASAAPKRRSAGSRKELKQILFIAEQYLGKTLSRTDVDSITYFYDSLGFSSDLIEYLIEYCVENGHKSMHYIEKVALSWSEEHISTVEQARNTSVLYNKVCYSILNAFGIKGRGPAVIELDFMKKWSEKDGFDLEIILEACNRTIATIHQPSFEYTDRILENWKTNQVHTLSDIQKVDSLREQELKASKKKVGNTTTDSKSAPGYMERSYDMDELEKQLLNTN